MMAFGKMVRFCSFFILASLVVACASSGGTSVVKLTKDHIEKRGTKIIVATMDNAFEATKAMLAARGFNITMENKESGTLVTERKFLRSQTVVNPYAGTATTIPLYRQYVAKIEEVGTCKVNIMLVPKVFVGEADQSNEQVWVLEGPSGEYALWDSMFGDIEMYVPKKCGKKETPKTSI